MSIEAVSWAFKQDVHPAAKKFVLVALADNADQHGICFPSYTHIEEKTSLTRRAVIENIKALIAEGLISKAARFRSNSSHSTNAYRIAIPGKNLDDHPLISLFEMGSAPDSPPLVNEIHHPSEAGSPPITINRTIKEKKGALSRTQFLREIDKGFQDGEFSAFGHLSESEVKFAAEAVWDYWAAKATWPGGDPVCILRNWIRGGMAQGKIRKSEKPKSGEGVQRSADDARWVARLQGYLERRAWLAMFGPAPDENGCQVPPHLMKEFFPDGKIPANA